MRLEGEAFDRLRLLPGEVDRDDLARAYAFPHDLNHEQRLRRLALQGQEAVRWEVELFDAEQRPLLDGWLARVAYRSLPLAGASGRAAVAFNARLVIREPFRRRGLARSIYASEDELYRRWGICEIHLDAIDDGPQVWIHLGFQLRDRPAIAREYALWARRRQGLPLALPDDDAAISTDFLRDYRGTMKLYKVIT